MLHDVTGKTEGHPIPLPPGQSVPALGRVNSPVASEGKGTADGPGPFLFMAFCGACFFFVMAFLLNEYRIHGREGRAHSRQSLDTTARAMAMQIEGYWKEKHNRLDILARKTGVGDLVREPGQTYENSDHPKITEQILAIAGASGFDRVIFFDRSGKRRFSSGPSMNDNRLADEGVADEIEKKGIPGKIFQAGGVHWLLAPLGHDDLTFLVQGLRDEKGRVTGFVAAGVDSASIKSLVERNEQVFKGCRLSVVNGEGRQVFGDSQGFFPSPLQREQGDPVKGYAGKRGSDPMVAVPVSMAGQDSPEWYVAARSTDDVYYQNIMKDHRQSLTVVAIVFFLFFAVFLIQTRLALKALGDARSFARNAAQGLIEDLGKTGGLDRAFGDLAIRLSEILSFLSGASRGDFRKRLPVRGDKDALGLAIHGTRAYFKAVHNQIERIAQGDYTPDPLDKRENDELAPLLAGLKETLRKMSEDSYRQITETHVQMELIRQLSGNQNLDLMVEQVLSFICGYAGAQIGVFYVVDENHPVFSLKGSYGCLRSEFPGKIQAGEGLAGQAALEKRPLFLEGPGVSGPLVKTGLTEISPASVFAYPFLFGGEVVAVMEIGAIGHFQRDVTDIIGKNSESVAIGIQSALSRNLTEKLLEKTINQAESLREQQEKLQSVNQELENQTRALKESQTRLLAREEELNRVNEALRIHSRNLEETKAVLETKAEELAKSNVYKTEFLANMSHELRTPLNSIILLSGILSERAASGITDEKGMEKIRTFSTVIQTSGKELLNLIDEVLDLTRIASGDMAISLSRQRPAETGRVMKRLYERTAREKNIAFHVQMADDLPEALTTDALRLERILKILLSNAFKYTSHGQITLCIRRADGADVAGNVGEQGEPLIEFAVSDTGEGIPENMKDVVFEAFKQVDGSTTRKHEGAGLGLALAREFARLLQGDILLDSSVGQGSTFRLFLPEKWQERRKTER